MSDARFTPRRRDVMTGAAALALTTALPGGAVAAPLASRRPPRGERRFVSVAVQ